MSASGKPAEKASRLQRLEGFLDHDPDNLSLIADAAASALEEGALVKAEALIERYAALAPLSPTMINLKGLAALRDQRFGEAAKIFEELLLNSPEDPALGFNLAWCRAMQSDHAGALEALTDGVVANVTRAAALKVQTLHHLGRLEDALACGMGLAERYPDDRALMGALATAAIDAEDIDLARDYATRAGETHEGLATLGMLTLNEDNIDQSLQLFERALLAYPESARALLGKGLVLLAKGDLSTAAPLIDHSAELFGSHLGTWVAAGWAHFVKGDYAASRTRFETALAMDDTFAEIHGGLAVLDIVDGQIDSAKRRTEVALRLDPRCFSAALAKTMLLTGAGDVKTAERIRNIALNTPISPNGRTIAQTMVAMGMAGAKGTGRR